MGAWGEGPFESDEAQDLQADVQASSAPGSVLDEALTDVLTESEALETSALLRGIAAAVLVACKHAGLPPPGNVKTHGVAHAWWEVTDELRRKAASVLQRAEDPEGNEWWALWEEARNVEAALQALQPYKEALLRH